MTHSAFRCIPILVCCVIGCTSQSAIEREQIANLTAERDDLRSRITELEFELANARKAAGVRMLPRTREEIEAALIQVGAKILPGDAEGQSKAEFPGNVKVFLFFEKEGLRSVVVLGSLDVAQDSPQTYKAFATLANRLCPSWISTEQIAFLEIAKNFAHSKFEIGSSHDDVQIEVRGLRTNEGTMHVLSFERERLRP